MAPSQASNMEIHFPASWRSPQTPGYGTYPGPYEYQGIDRYLQTVKTALLAGFRHIDTAQTYDNEQYVGQAIRASGIARDEIFLTSKVEPSLNSYEGALSGIQASVSALQTQPDMYLLHYPGEGDPCGAWKGLLQAKAQGLCKHVGVSNCEITHLQILRKETGAYPALNQIEFHPLIYSHKLSELVKFCRGAGIAVEGYCPLAQGKRGILTDPNIQTIARRHGCSPARVLLKWSMQHGVRPIVGTLNPTHIVKDFGSYSFTLTSEEMATINALGTAQVRASLDWDRDPTQGTFQC